MKTTQTYFLTDTLVMLGRCLRHVFRSLDTIITVTLMPIAMLLLFVFVLGGAIQTGADKYVNYLLPGILLIAVANSVGYISYRLFLDRQNRIFERFRSMPITRSAALWGHVLTSLVSNLISLIIIVLVAMLIGFRSPAGAGSWLAAAGILALFTLALTWIAAIAGLSAKTIDGASVIAYPIHLLPLISSTFVPTASMPPAVRAFAENQPVTPIAETLRALLFNQPLGNELWLALVWCCGIILIASLLAMKVYRQ